MSADGYRHLGSFSGIVGLARQLALAPSQAKPPPSQVAHSPGPPADPTRVRQVLGFDADGVPGEPRVEWRWSAGGVDGEEVSWSVGYGPRTRAWLLRPAGHDPVRSGLLPGVLALHCHGGYKWHGKEKIADGPHGPLPELESLRTTAYGGRAWANELARRGFVVLVPDVLMWGSRRIPVSVLEAASGRPGPADGDIDGYNTWAAGYEHVLAKYCTVLGATLAGAVAYEDRIAAAFLASRPEVRPGPLGCAGLSGGGCRAVLLQATCPLMGATVVTGMMSSYAGLLDHNIAGHTWMLFPAGLPALADWPDVAACRAPSPLLVQYLLDDELFTPEGMRVADGVLVRRYADAGAPAAYAGEFYPGQHRLDVPLQDAAFAWLANQLS